MNTVVKNYVLIISIFFFGCVSRNQKEIIPKDTFIQILLYYENTIVVNQDTSIRFKLSHVCSQYGETLDSYDITMDHYLDNPDEMLLILNAVKDSI